jgi:hypoxia up-regulated 1
LFDFEEQPIDAAVISVPAYFTQAERKAVLRSAELANLKVLQLLNSNTAGKKGVFNKLESGHLV